MEKQKADDKNAKASPDADKASSNGDKPSKARAPAITPITQGSESQVNSENESFEKSFEKFRETKAPNILRRKRH